MFEEGLPDKKSLAISPSVIMGGAAGGVATALVGVPVLAQAAPDPSTTVTSQINGLGTVVAAAGTIAGAPIVIWFAYRIFKRVVSAGT